MDRFRKQGIFMDIDTASKPAAFNLSNDCLLLYLLF